MDVKEAVRVSKRFVSDLFQDEGLINLGLEEIEHDNHEGTWNVTLGFSRPWNRNETALTALTGAAQPTRAYRVVKVRDADGEILSVKVRDVQEQ